MTAPSAPVHGQRVRAIGTPPALPLRLAARVAWSSIRVRLARSLVTLSSVVLAVAFLLAVAGESVADRAVHRDFTAASRAETQVQRLRDVLARPRDALTLLELAGMRGDEARAWAAVLVHRPLAAVPAARAAEALVLARWVAGLKPTQAYLVTRNRAVDEWLLHLDAAGVASLLDVAKGFKGARLPLDRAALLGLAATMPELREQVEALREAESARLAQVARAGGAGAVLEALRTGRSGLAESGLPLDQVLPSLDAAQLEGLRTQLRLDRLRAAGARALAELDRQDPSLLTPGDVLDWSLLAARLREQLAATASTPAKRLREASGAAALFAPEALDLAARDDHARAGLLAALDRALAAPELYDPAAWPQASLPAEARSLIAQDPARLDERKRTRLARLLVEAAFAPAIASHPPTGPHDLRLVVEPGRLDDPAERPARDALLAALGIAGLDELRGELRRRAELQALGQTFAALAYDPAAGGGRTFWLVALSLLVCVVGIVNAMMMAVTERFREIATMKCLGAMDGFILESFLIESAAVGLAGSGLGAAIGLLIVVGQAHLRFGDAFWAAFPAGGLALAALAALGCGLVLAVLGALLPAFRAARMHPIEAMRVEA